MVFSCTDILFLKKRSSEVMNFTACVRPLLTAAETRLLNSVISEQKLKSANKVKFTKSIESFMSYGSTRKGWISFVKGDNPYRKEFGYWYDKCYIMI